MPAVQWQDIAGPTGKAKAISNKIVTGPGVHIIEGIPGEWSTDEAGALIVTASIEDGVRINGRAVAGTAEVPEGNTLEFGQGRTGAVSGFEGTYGLELELEW